MKKQSLVFSLTVDSNIQWHHSSSIQIQMKLCISSTVYFLYSPHSHGNSTCKLCTLFGCTCFKTDSRNKQQYNVMSTWYPIFKPTSILSKIERKKKPNTYNLVFKQAFPLVCFKDKNKLNKLNQTNLPQKIKQNSREWKG